jgi:hypothetical protein
MDELKTQRQGDVVIRTLPVNSDIQYIIGGPDRGIRVISRDPYSSEVCEFLNDLSGALMADIDAKRYPDIISFAYWCRNANVARLKREFSEKHLRLGLGLVFHITPSNVPVNFAFSFVFSLLAGNANVVRVSTKDFPQTDILCRVIKNLLEEERYAGFLESTIFVRYPHNDEITLRFSEMCNARIVWGGDRTIRAIRKMSIPERSAEIVFADRYSFCIIDAEAVSHLDDAGMNRLANGFYNDAYLMDQNACSSPHLVVWLNTDRCPKSKKIFWDSVYSVVLSKYELHPVSAIDKYVLLCESAIGISNVTELKRYGNYLYCIEIDGIPDQLDSFRGKYGLFYEYNAKDVNCLSKAINLRYQTLTYFGVDKSCLADFVVKNRLSGIDRIVPIGSALDIGVIWDGYDIVRTLSRIIECK